MKDSLKNVSPEIRLFQRIVEEAVDDIYVINKENFDLFYVNGRKSPHRQKERCAGIKCYQVLYGKSAPLQILYTGRNRRF